MSESCCVHDTAAHVVHGIALALQAYVAEETGHVQVMFDAPQAPAALSSLPRTYGTNTALYWLSRHMTQRSGS